VSSIEKAKRSICIAGWGINLDYDLGHPEQKRLVDLLIQAALRGTNVHLLIWDKSVLSNAADSRKAIKTAVRKGIERLPTSKDRQRAKEHFFIKSHPGRSWMHSMHSKYIITDNELYLGGLDLAHKRDSTPYHITYQPDADIWHDAHVKVSGQIVDDAMFQFYRSWSSIDNRRLDFGEQHSADHTLLRTLATKTEPLSNTGTKSSVTLLSSFDFSQRHQKNDIYEAYSKAIAGAKNEILISNQYFVQASEHSPNQIPQQLIDKITSKHNAKEKFKVTIILPYYPKGVDGMTTAILREYTYKTLKRLIGSINEKTQGNADGYIRVVCPHTTKLNGEKAYIYHHDKLMIVDDDELIIGSANCNERSLAPHRDDEANLHVKANGHKDMQKKIKEYREELFNEI